MEHYDFVIDADVIADNDNGSEGEDDGVLLSPSIKPMTHGKEEEVAKE